jgi:hypothetical protein
MTAPFVPELLTPANRGASAPGSVTLTWKMRTAAAGDYMATYAIRRRVMTPTPGAYEYWTGAAWGAETFLAGPTAPNQVFDGMTGSVTITTGWVTDKVYQWSVKCRNAAAEASAYADDALIQVHAAPTMTLAVSSSAVSRPTLSWLWAGAAGYYQKTYRIAIYSAAVYGAVGFDPASAVWQALATYIMPAVKYSSSDYKIAIDADLSSGTTYRAYYITTDTSDLSSGWINGLTISPSYTAVPAPTLTVVPDASNGVANITVRSSFNLLTDDQSIFTAGIGSWVATLNAETSHDSVNGKLSLLETGMSYADMNAAHASYTAENTAYASHAAQRDTQLATVGTSRVVSGDVNGERVAVTPAVQYSAVATVNSSIARTFKLGFRWFTSGGAASTTPVTQGTGVLTVAGVDSQIYVLAATAPADAAFASVEIEWTTSSAATPATTKVDNVAMASATTISWSPSGNNFDVSFVVERSTDNVTWKPVWGCSKLSPKPSDSGSVSQIVVADRAVSLGTAQIFYRAYAVSKFTSSPVWSSVASQTLAGMAPQKWWLRRTETIGADSQVIIGQISESQALQREVFEAEGRTNPIVGSSSAPKTRMIDVNLMTTDRAMHEAIMNALRSEETLYIQTNRDGEGYYVRAVDTIRKNQRRAVATESYNAVRHLFDVQFSAVVVDDFY